MKINSNLNKNYYTQQKQPTFGVRKSDSVQSFINEIRTTNPNLGDIERLPIVQKIKESDTFEQLQERANVNRSMFENKRSFNIAGKKGFTTFINSICIKIMNELRQLGETVGKFIVQIEDENGNKKENDIINAFRQRLYLRNPEKRKEDNKQYYETHKDERRESNKQYYETHKDERREYHKQYYETHSEELKQKRKQYRENHSEELKQKRKKYRENHLKKMKQCHKNFCQVNKNEIKKSVEKPLTTLQNDISFFDLMCSNSLQPDEMNFDLMYFNKPLQGDEIELYFM